MRIFAAQVLHTCVEAGLRHGVSEAIGLGIRFRRERSRWKSRCLIETQTLPLARDLSAG